MSDTNRFIIRGGLPLKGKIKPSGAKNAALKMIAAATLTSQTVSIKNVPQIKDVITLIEILSEMGAEIAWKDESDLVINCRNLDPSLINQNKVGHLRGSVVLIGPLLARFGKLRIHEPGGCHLGARPITAHINALRDLGALVSKNGKFYLFEAKKLIGNRIILDEISVTTTENILMAACLAQGTTEIHLAAIEPEIGNLIDLLTSMGAKIIGRGTSVLTIIGQKELKSGKIEVIPDRIEIGTYACAIAATRGHAEISNVIPNHLDNLLNKFNQMKINYSFAKPIKNDQENTLVLRPSGEIKPVYIDTRPYPGFSTDLQSPMVVLLTQADGKSRLFETLFEGRMEYTKALIDMGAKIDLLDNRNIGINGPTKLKGREVTSPDLRGGAAMVLAGLIASGTTIVSNTSIIDRGYENMPEKLAGLGARVERA